MKNQKHRKSAALSAQSPSWQSGLCRRTLRWLGLAGALGAATAALATQGGPIGTLPLGRYICELPGSANGPTGIRQPDADFTILHASRYAVGDDAGTYLMTSGVVHMTSGPHKGLSYRRISESFVRRLNPDGSESSLRCVRGVPNNGG